MTSDSGGHSAAATRRLRPTWRGVGLLLIGAVSAGLLFVVAPPAEVLKQIDHMSLAWLAVAVGLEIFSCLSYVIIFRHFFPEPTRRDSRRVAWIAMGAGALLPGGNFSSVAATGVVMRGNGIGVRQVLSRSGALLCLLVGIGFLVNGAAGVLLLAGVPDGPLDLSHSGIPILVSVVALSSATLVVVLSRRGGERTPAPIRALTGALDGAWTAVRHPTWRLLGAVGFTCLDVAALWAAMRRDRPPSRLPGGPDRLLHRLPDRHHPHAGRTRSTRLRPRRRARALRPSSGGIDRSGARLSRDLDLGARMRRRDRPALQPAHKVH